jgi:hypothetical protein
MLIVQADFFVGYQQIVKDSILSFEPKQGTRISQQVVSCLSLKGEDVAPHPRGDGG